MTSLKQSHAPRWEDKATFHLMEVVVFWEGRLTTRHLMDAFGLNSRTTASQLIKRYRELAPSNLEYCHQTKGYLPTKGFTRLFSRGDVGEYLSLLNQHAGLNPDFSSLSNHFAAPTEQVSAPHRAVRPEIVRKIIEATQNKHRLEVVYRSQTSPLGEARIISPHTLVFADSRWHVRAWCEKHRDFRDFVLTRFVGEPELEGPRLPDGAPNLDTLWQERMDVIFTPNPTLPESHRQLIAEDYAMSDDLQLSINCRKALVTYLLLSMNVHLDESRFEPQAHPLVVLNKDEVESVSFGAQ